MKKSIAILLSALMLVAALSVGTLAAEDESAPAAYYIPVTGTVTDVNEYIGTDEKPVEGWYFIGIELENEGVAVLLVTDKTYYPFDDEINAGDTVTGYYKAGMPMIMIYPPRYSVDVLVTGMPDSRSVKVDRFTAREDGPAGYLVSGDNQLAITIGEKTAVTTPDGEAFDGTPDGRSLVVIYDISTRSIPARTTPISVVVLPEEPEAEPVETPAAPDVAGMPIIVNGEEITAPDAFMADGEIVMLPLRAIAEALGFTVEWDGGTRTVTLDDDILLTIGNANCTSGEREILLAAAPVIVADRTYVPMHFFKDAAGVNNAYVFEGQIVIDRGGEIME